MPEQQSAAEDNRDHLHAGAACARMPAPHVKVVHVIWRFAEAAQGNGDFPKSGGEDLRRRGSERVVWWLAAVFYSVQQLILELVVPVRRTIAQYEAKIGAPVTSPMGGC